MIHSIRRFLLISLILMATVILSIIAIGSYWLSQHTIAASLAKPFMVYFILIMLIMYSIFTIVIWITLATIKSSLSRLTYHVAHCAPTQLQPIHSSYVSREFKPLVKKLNRLFARSTRALKRRERFSADTAHELRTPLAALKIQAQVALKTIQDTKTRDMLLDITHSVDRCSHVVAQLLTLSTLSQEETLNDRRLINLHPLTAEILAHLAPIALDKKVDIELTSPPQDSTILGNDIAIGILIRNLVDNAIRYTPPKGTVTTSITNTARSVLLRITDTGRGIPEQFRERVFDRFYRIAGTEQTGSGLGLAIVRQIVELHHAHISLDTPENGIGLQINILFPKPTTKKKQTAFSLKKRRRQSKRKSK